MKDIFTPDFETADSTGDSTADSASAEKPAFVIDTEDKVNWYLSTLAEKYAEKARITAQVAKRVLELDTDIADFTGLFAAQVEAFGRAEAARRRRRTVTLMQGTLEFRTLPATFKVGNQADALTTARAALPGAVTEETVTNVSLDANAFLRYARARFEETGEVVTGAHRSEPREKFTVKIPGAPKEEAETAE